MFVARLDVLYGVFQVLVYTGQLADVGKDGQPEQPQSLVVCLENHAVVIEHNDTCIDAIHDQLVIFLFLNGIRFGLEEYLRDAVK